MKYPCEIIRDLLPLYHDSVCAPQTREAVEEHLNGCPPCQEYYQALLQADRLEPDRPAAQTEKPDVKAMASLKKLLHNARVKVSLICAAVVLGLAAIALPVGMWLNSATVVMPEDLIGKVELVHGDGPFYLERGNILVYYFNEKWKDYRYCKDGGVWTFPVKVDLDNDGKEEWIFICGYRLTLWEEFQFKMGWNRNEAYIVDPPDRPQDELTAGNVSVQWSQWHEYGELYDQPGGTQETPDDPDCFVDALYYVPDCSLIWDMGAWIPPEELHDILLNHAVLLWEKEDGR